MDRATPNAPTAIWKRMPSAMSPRVQAHSVPCSRNTTRIANPVTATTRKVESPSTRVYRLK